VLHSKVTAHPTADWTRQQFREAIPSFAWACWPTHSYENRAESAGVRSSRRGTAKIVVTLDEVRPFPSLIWDARFEPICVAPPPGGKGVAREGV
jgi:hypothetical protein